MTLRLQAFAAACLLSMSCMGAPVPDNSAAEDSVTETVAVFLASNLKQGIEGAISQLRVYGIEIDRPKLDSILVSQIILPYDAQEHLRVSHLVSELIAASATRQSEQLLASATLRPASVTLPSGVVIVPLEEGNGATPDADAYVTMRYTGFLPDGSVFDEIEADAEPMRAHVSDLAPGLAEALTHTRTGGRYDIYIPAPLAYGSEGVPGVIPPDTALQFTVELISLD